MFRIAVPKYRHTLWSWTTGRQCVHDYFLKGSDEEAKFEIFGCNLLLWESDIGEEVKAWTAENWARWKEEKPAWFKPEQVPDHFIPAAELAQLGYWLEPVSWYPRAFHLHNFMSPQEADRILEIARPRCVYFNSRSTYRQSD